LDKPLVALGEALRPQLLQVRRGGRALTPLRERRDASFEIQTAAFAHIARTLARAAHLVHLRAQGRDSLSLCCNRSSITGKPAHWGGVAQCRSVLLASETASRSAGRGLSFLLGKSEAAARGSNVR
jgi:hypothetical protein